MQHILQHLSHRLSEPLPGVSVQFEMAGVYRQPVPPPADARQSAVMVLLYPHSDDLHFVLIQRSATHNDDKHKGQIGLPGGKHEEVDVNFLQTALRELEEEIGVISNHVQVLGALTPIYIPVSGFQVHPFVGFLPERPSFTLQDTEVVGMIEAPLTWLKNGGNKQLRPIRINSEVVLKDIPCFVIEHHVIWGATAMMLNEFKNCLI